ncbi:conserved hypothetical protein, partial [Trichinella spiralis]
MSFTDMLFTIVA